MSLERGLSSPLLVGLRRSRIVVRCRIVKRPRILTPGPATRTFLWIRGRFLGRQAVGSLSSIYQYDVSSPVDSPLQMRMGASAGHPPPRFTPAQRPNYNDGEHS